MMTSSKVDGLCHNGSLEDQKDQVTDRSSWRKSMWTQRTDTNLRAYNQFKESKS